VAKFTLPALKKHKNPGGALVSEPYDDLINDAWYRKVRIPVNKEILDALKVGEDASITLTGRIISLESKQNEKKVERQELEIEISAVETDSGKNEFSELVEDD